MAEQVLCAVPVHKPRFFRTPEPFAPVVTDRRSILVPMTKEMLLTAAKDAQQKAKDEGKGFMGRWGAQLKKTLGYTQRYLTMESSSGADRYGRRPSRRATRTRRSNEELTR